MKRFRKSYTMRFFDGRYFDLERAVEYAVMRPILVTMATAATATVIFASLIYYLLNSNH